MRFNILLIRNIFFYSIFSTTAILLAYYPGLSGGFVFDDISNILAPSGIQMQELSWDDLKNAALSMEKRAISRASFGLNYLATGFDAFYFKLINIAIHSINAVLVFLFVLLFLRHITNNTDSVSERNKNLFLAAAVSTAWALHPVNVTNVLYVVQRMNSLSAMFVLAGMITYISGRTLLDDAPYKGWILIYSSIFIFLPLAWFSKENGALLPLFLLTIELTLLRFSTQKKSQQAGLFLFYVAFVLLPVVFALTYIFQHTDQLLASYDNRHFNLLERLLTEPRVMWLYIQMIILPVPSLFGLFHDDIAISASLTDPLITSLALIGLIALFVVGLAGIKRAPILSFGLLFFFTGHLMESTFIPLELAFEHRNYLPSIGLLLLLFYYLLNAGDAVRHRKSRYIFILLIIIIFAFQTHLRAWTWSDNLRLYLTEVQYHPKSPRANYEAGKIYGQRLERGQGDPEKNYIAALEHFNRVTSLRKNTTSGLFGIIVSSIDYNQKIQPEWINELTHRLESRPLEQVNLLWLDKLTDCVSQRRCRKEDIQIPRLVNAAMDNQHANRTNKAMLSAILAKYMYQVEKDKYSTIILARKSVSFLPSNMYYRINLAKYLIWARKPVEAREVLLSTKKIDVYNQYATEIARLLNQLEHKQ